MCGIFGIEGDFLYSELEAATESMQHRGPDGMGYFVEEGKVGLGHVRLAIQDLSDNGRQPMTSSNGKFVICFNGEIYNFKELRKKYLPNHIFKSGSDTEVILELFALKGPAFLKLLNGIYALAIWDKEKELLFIARDPFGVKPLYFYQEDKTFIFSSEIKSMLAIKSFKKSLDYEAITRCLTFLWSPYPDTTFEHVKKLKPGTYMCIKNTRIIEERSFYKKIFNNEVSFSSQKELEGLVAQQIEGSVKNQMVSDAPLGSFLSGGLDSTAVTYFAARKKPDGFQSFTINALDLDPYQEGISEDLSYAKQFADNNNIDLNIVEISSSITEELDKIIFHLDEPQADPAIINTYLISKLAREKGIKVLLSGTGGDDVFSGYRRHQAFMMESYWTWLPEPIRSGLKGLSSKLAKNSQLSRRISKAFSYADLDTESRLISYFFWLNPEIVMDIISPNISKNLNENIFYEPFIKSLEKLDSDTEGLNKMLYLEQEFFLMDHNLNYTDKMGMANGVEIRVPLIDLDLVNLINRIPANYKFSGLQAKYIFKKAMVPFLDKNLIFRKKEGFGAPLRTWIKNDLKDQVDDLLSEESLRENKIFNAKKMSEIIELNKLDKIDASYTIFSALCVEKWINQFS